MIDPPATIRAELLGIIAIALWLIIIWAISGPVPWFCNLLRRWRGWR